MGAADPVGVGRSEDLAGQKVGLEGLARAAGSYGEHRDDVGRVDDAGRDAGREAEGDRACVAAGCGDAGGADESARAASRADRKLGHAVCPGLVEVAAVEPVPLGDRFEPVIRPAVDDQGGVGQGVGVLPGLPVRQREEDDVMAGEGLGRRVLQRQVRQRAEMRLVRDEGVAGVRVRRDGADLDVGMIGEEAEDLATRIAGCAGDGDRVRHGFYLMVRSAEAGDGDTGCSTRWKAGSARGRLRSAVALTPARGSGAHKERRGKLRGRRHVATIAVSARYPQIRC